jgi:hypothetical protein
MLGVLVGVVAATEKGSPGTPFSCSFERSWTGCGFHEQAKAPGRFSLVEVAGRKGVRLLTQPGDSGVAGSGPAERSDLALSREATDCSEGREQWWAHSILFPDDYVDAPMSEETTWNWAVVFDFHNSSSGNWQANFQIVAWPASALHPDRPTGLGFQVAHGSQRRPTVVREPIGPIVRNVWYDFVYHIKWSSGADGFIDAWVNGEPKMRYRGPTLYPGQGCYLKLANYHTPFGKPSAVVHARVMRGSSAAAVSPGPLREAAAR